MAGRWSWRVAGSLVALALGLLGCPAPGERSLLDHGLWEASETSDPWPEHRPATTDCSPLAWTEEVTAEGSSLEIDAGACDYLVLTQGSLDTVAAGEVVRFIVRHGELDAGEPAEGHVGLVLDGWDLLDEAVSIPSGEASWTLSTEAPRGILEGAPILLHLHNHGANTWNLDSLTVAPAAD